MNKTTAVNNTLRELAPYTLCSIFNDFCDNTGRTGDKLYFTPNIDNDWSEEKPYTVLKYFKEFDLNCLFYVKQSFGAQEVWDIWEDWIDYYFTNELAEYIIANNKDYGNTALRSALAA